MYVGVCVQFVYLYKLSQSFRIDVIVCAEFECFQISIERNLIANLLVNSYHFNEFEDKTETKLNKTKSIDFKM